MPCWLSFPTELLVLLYSSTSLVQTAPSIPRTTAVTSLTILKISQTFSHMFSLFSYSFILQPEWLFLNDYLRAFLPTPSLKFLLTSLYPKACVVWCLPTSPSLSLPSSGYWTSLPRILSVSQNVCIVTLTPTHQFLREALSEFPKCPSPAIVHLYLIASTTVCNYI